MSTAATARYTRATARDARLPGSGPCRGTQRRPPSAPGTHARRRFRPLVRRQSPVKGGPAAHRPFDDLRVPQHRFPGDLLLRDLAHDELEAADPSSLERCVVDSPDGWEGAELVDDPVHVDHLSASPIATGSPCSSSVATDER